MNTANARRFKNIVQDAAHHAGVNYRRYREDFDLDAFFDSIQNEADGWTIAVEAVRCLCCGQNGFNNNVAGMKSVFRFLFEIASSQPQSEADVAACLGDLKQRVNSGKTSAAEIRKWLDDWYQP